MGRASGDRMKELTKAGAFYGFGVGFACWLLAVAIDRL
jgi:hypothetical protein